MTHGGRRRELWRIFRRKWRFLHIEPVEEAISLDPESVRSRARFSRHAEAEYLRDNRIRSFPYCTRAEHLKDRRGRSSYHLDLLSLGDEFVLLVILISKVLKYRLSFQGRSDRALA